MKGPRRFQATLARAVFLLLHWRGARATSRTKKCRYHRGWPRPSPVCELQGAARYRRPQLPPARGVACRQNPRCRACSGFCWHRGLPNLWALYDLHPARRLLMPIGYPQPFPSMSIRDQSRFRIESNHVLSRYGLMGPYPQRRLCTEQSTVIQWLRCRYATTCRHGTTTPSTCRMPQKRPT